MKGRLKFNFQGNYYNAIILRRIIIHQQFIKIIHSNDSKKVLDSAVSSESECDRSKECCYNLEPKLFAKFLSSRRRRRRPLLMFKFILSKHSNQIQKFYHPVKMLKNRAVVLEQLTE